MASVLLPRKYPQQENVIKAQTDTINILTSIIMLATSTWSRSITVHADNLFFVCQSLISGLAVLKHDYNIPLPLRGEE